MLRGEGVLRAVLAGGGGQVTSFVKKGKVVLIKKGDRETVPI